jgi:hypothetical protein
MGFLAMVLTSPLSASADSAPTGAALFMQARSDAAAGDYEHACPRFAESLRLAPAVGTLLNLADCEERRGHVADALAHFRHALESLPPTDDRVRFTQGSIARLTPRVPHVRLHAVGPPPAEVALDGVKLGEAAMGVPLPVNPGDHTVVTRAPGRQDLAYPFRASEGHDLDLTVAVGEPVPVPRQEPAPSPKASAARPVLWASAIVGGVGVAVGAVTGGLALDFASRVRDECHNGVCPTSAGINNARTGSALSTASTVGFIAGAVGVSVAAVLFFRGDRRGRSATELSPLLGPRTAGFVLSTQFD